MYNKQTDNNKLYIIQNPKNILNIKLSETDKIIGFVGSGMFIVRKIKDIALCNNENDNIYISKKFNNKYYQKPIWNFPLKFLKYKLSIYYKKQLKTKITKNRLFFVIFSLLL